MSFPELVIAIEHAGDVFSEPELKSIYDKLKIIETPI